jgi:PAS domain S-box-containing protein
MKPPRKKFHELRKQAETLLAAKEKTQGKDFDGDPLKLIHELQTFQIEVELQNEELRLSQKELMESQNSYAELYDFAPVGYLIVSKKGLIQKVNLTLADMLSMERAYLINQPLSACIVPEDQDIYYKCRQKLKDSGTRQLCELRMQKKDGTFFYAQLESSAILDKCGDLEQHRTVVVDISERKRTEEELAKHHECLEKLVQQRTTEIQQQRYFIEKAQEIGHIGVWNLDIKNNKLTWTDEIYRIFEIAIGTKITYETYLDCVHPDDRESVDMEWKAAFKDKPYDTEHRIIVNGKIKWVREKAELKFNEKNEGIHGIGFTQDITRQKLHEQEKRELEEQLRQAQKMESLGTLAGGIAHDFNNILTSIIAYTQLLEMHKFPDEDYRKNSLTQILQSAYQASDLVKQIMTFSRKTVPIKEPLILEHVVRDVVKMIRASLPSTIDIQGQIHSERCIVFADSTQMHQVMMNLCTNAAHAMGTRGGILAIKLDIVNLSTKQCQSMNQIIPGKYVEIKISDTGDGIAPENIKQIFNPYFTTKKLGGGTGLGLSVTHGIIKNHGGDILVSSRLGQGTCFKVFIPYFLKEGIKGEKTQPMPMPSGNAVVLFVDDEISIAKGVQIILKHLEYKVISKTSGKQALETFMKTPEQFDVVITDLTMPGMTGDLLALEIKKIRPDIPVILCTGFLEGDPETILSKYGIDAFIRKPYDRQTLIESIQTVMAKTKGYLTN